MVAPLLAGLAGCADAPSSYPTAASRRYDGPYCEGLVRFYQGNRVQSARFSDSRARLLSAFLGYNIRYASARQRIIVAHRLRNCAAYYDDLERAGGPDPLTGFYTRYRARQNHRVILRLLAIVPYPRPEPMRRYAAVRKPPARNLPPPPIAQTPPVQVSTPMPVNLPAAPSRPLPAPDVNSKVTSSPLPAVQPTSTKSCSSAKTIASLKASYRADYHQGILRFKDYKTIVKQNGAPFTYCSAYAITPNDSHTIRYKFLTGQDGTVTVFPVR